MGSVHIFVSSFLAWSVVLAGVAAAMLVRSRCASCFAAMAAGGFLGLVGPQFELIDLYFTSAGWKSIDALTVTAVLLAALACLMWWVIVRVLCATTRRLWRVRNEPRRR